MPTAKTPSPLVIDACIPAPLSLAGIRAKASLCSDAFKLNAADIADVIDRLFLGPVFTSMLALRKTLQIGRIIVCWIAVAMVDVMKRRNLAVEATPYLASGCVVFARAVHAGRIISPYRRSDNGTKPLASTQTG